MCHLHHLLHLLKLGRHQLLSFFVEWLGRLARVELVVSAFTVRCSAIELQPTLWGLEGNKETVCDVHIVQECSHAQRIRPKTFFGRDGETRTRILLIETQAA